jgi:hypothetical protein
LRSAIEICKHGGSVTESFREKVFRMLYDNRRVVFDKPINSTSALRDSKPVFNVSEAALNRFVGSLDRKVAYNKNTQVTDGLCTKYNNRLDICVRQFIRGLFSKSYNTDIGSFNNYKELVDFIKAHDKNYKINENMIALLKRRPAVKRSNLEKSNV